MIVPDLVAGNLLNEGASENKCFMDYVMLGMNGLEYISPEDPGSAHFLHSSGHLAIAALTRYLKQSRNDKAEKTRLILVLSCSKCAEKHDDHEEFSKSNKVNQQSETVIKEGFLFCKRKNSGPIRTQPFLIRDEDIRAELFNAGIRLYNPREDSVMLAMVDDIIADGECFIGDATLRIFREWLYAQKKSANTNC